MILVLNSGSSSIKFKLYEHKSLKMIVSGTAQKIGEKNSIITVSDPYSKTTKELILPNHTVALKKIEEILISQNYINSFSSLFGVGHRVVHGGEDFHSPTLIDESVIESIKSNIPLAPLHNRANLEGIKSIYHISPNIPQVAVFDTAFHQSMPPKAYRYAIPKELYTKYKIRRYGFHGTSHYYVSKKVAKLIKRDYQSLKIITLHLGNGASACAIDRGKSIDTSMGMTPLEGLVMGTRSGDIDAGVVLFLSNMVSTKEIDNLLNRESGLKGLCGINDLREIQKETDKNSDAQLALEVMVHRIIKYIGAYYAILGGLDAIVFTGGIGEHSALVREMVAKQIEHFGIEFDKTKNETTKNDAFEITKDTSSVKVWVIPTDEELVIATYTKEIIEAL